MRILTFSTLYPNATAPQFGVFVENRLRQLLASGEVEARVVAPVPWVPGDYGWLGSYARLARIPAEEHRHGIAVRHPRYPQLPRIGETLHPLGLALGALPALRRLQREGFDFELIDAHYFYPDGVAAALLARWLGKPFVVTARGTDLVTIAKHPLPQRMIRAAAEAADGLITVSASLAGELAGLGIASERVTVLRNGVDLAHFRPAEREAARARFGVSGPAPVLASVGHLIPRKGNEWILRALPALPGVRLLIAGQGPEQAMLEGLIRELGLAGRVTLLGEVAHAELSQLYSAADVLVLATGHEGWPNVVLEAMACGTPVVAPPVFGIAEMLAAPEAGLVIGEATAAAIAEGVGRFLATPPDRAAIRAIAERFSWDETSQGQLALFRRVLAGARPPC